MRYVFIRRLPWCWLVNAVGVSLYYFCSPSKKSNTCHDLHVKLLNAASNMCVWCVRSIALFDIENRQKLNMWINCRPFQNTEILSVPLNYDFRLNNAKDVETVVNCVYCLRLFIINRLSRRLFTSYLNSLAQKSDTLFLSPSLLMSSPAPPSLAASSFDSWQKRTSAAIFRFVSDVWKGRFYR